MNTYSRLLQYIKPHRGRLALAVLCSQVTALATAAVSATLYLIINGMQNKEEVVINDLPHLPFLMNVRFSVAWIPLIMVAVFVVRSLFEYISHYQMSSVGLRAIRRIRDDLYGHLVSLSHDHYSRGRTGDFLSRILNDVSSIQGAITDVVYDLVKQPFVILYTLVPVFIFGGLYALIAVAVFPVVVIPITLLGRSLRRTTKKMQERSADITSFIGETLTGIHIVKAFNREEVETRRFQEINKGVFDYFKKTIKVTLIQRPLIEVMGAAGAAIAIWFSFEHLPFDRFGGFVASLFLLYDPLKKMSKVNSTIQQSLAAGGRIFEILDARPSIQDRPGAAAFQGRVEEIRFDEISFGYEPGRPVLERIDLKVRRGEILAIVGPSGAGKTTLVNLIPRFYDPTSGALRLNGTDIRELTLRSLRELLGIVSQETVLFNGTVRENIAYHRPDAPLAKVERAAEAANAAGFIRALPQGYDTPLGERGMKLSGGQRQRLSIARAIFKDPPILILDEATSHLDTESEREVQSAIENLMQGRTVFVIAHRLSTIQRAHRIIVLQEGRIIQRGTNESLLQEEGAYKRLHDLQFNL